MKRVKNNREAKKIKKYRKQQLQDQGVTMLALVITIIILLILSGITIRFVVGEDGIIEKAKQAGLKYQNSALQEQLFFNSIEEQLKSSDAGASSGNSSGGSGSDSGDSGGSSSGSDQDYQTTIDNLNEAVEDLQRQVDVLKEKLVETEEERDTAEEKVKELENQITELQKIISELESKQATGNATVKDVISGKTFSNSSGTGLVGTLISHSAYTSSLSIGVNDDTAYFRIPQGAYVTNTTTGYPEITAKIADINEATGYKYTQEQYDNNYNKGYEDGYNAGQEDYKESIRPIRTISVKIAQSCTRSGTVGYNGASCTLNTVPSSGKLNGSLSLDVQYNGGGGSSKTATIDSWDSSTKEATIYGTLYDYHGSNCGGAAIASLTFSNLPSGTTCTLSNISSGGGSNRTEWYYISENSGTSYTTTSDNSTITLFMYYYRGDESSKGTSSMDYRIDLPTVKE